MKKSLILISILIVVFMVSGCVIPDVRTEEHLPFTIVDPDTLDEQMGESIELIKDLRGYAVLKETMNEVYIYVGSGERPTGGYSIEADKLIKTGNFNSAVIKETSPGPDDMVTEALTYPFVVFKMDRNTFLDTYFFDGENIALPHLNYDPSETDISIRGEITSYTESEGIIRILVESKGTKVFSYDKASIRIDKNTLVIADGKRYTAGQLKEKDLVSIIFHGPVAESYPVQAYGAVVVKENIPEELSFESIKDEQPNVIHIGNERGYSVISNDEEIVLMISSGERPTGGYSVNVDSVSFDGTTIFVKVIETSPAKDAMVIQVITYPYDLVRFDKVNYIGIEVVNQEYEVFLKVK